MKEEMVFKMSDKDEKLLNLLCNAGFTGPEGKILVYLTNFKEAKSRDIETAMELSQPEVSIAIKEIANLVETEKTYKKARGRPVYTYKLKKSLPDIIDEIVDEKIEKIKDNIEEIKKLLL